MLADHYLYLALTVVLLITLVEALVGFFGADSDNKRDSLANLGIYAGSIIIDRLITNTFNAFILISISRFALSSIPNTAFNLAALFVVMDFIYYWKHRWEHELRGFWAHHSVHHSSNYFNFSTALRVGWLGPIYGWIYLVPPVLLGFEPLAVIMSYRVILLLQFWVHSNKIGKLGFLEKIINTPSNHRVHHGSDPKYIDKNYGGVFIIWDRLFDTYQPEEEKPTYGLVKPITLHNPIAIVLHEPRALIGDMRRQKNWRQALRVLVRYPGWSPELERTKEAQAANKERRVV